MKTRIWASFRDTAIVAAPAAAAIGAYHLVTMLVPGWAVALAVFLVLWRAYYIEGDVGADWLPRFGDGDTETSGGKRDCLAGDRAGCGGEIRSAR